MTGRPSDRWVRIGLLAGLALLVAHALYFRFLCDDAFISFRYARNLANGHGLVFNPGFERVEGYTNFLWVIVLAALDVVGIAPERAASAISILLTVFLWGLVARAALRLIPEGPWRAAVLLPTAWLAITRSVAVWSTSGLETRLFEVLVVAGVLRLIDDVAAADGVRRRAPIGAALLALAALTRPDGVLIGAATMATAAVVLAARRRLKVADVAAHAIVFGAIVGGHLLFRHAYYGDWVPNTYYAKVGGRSWWGMGVAYLACFAIEYAAWLWLPLIAAGAADLVKSRRTEAPLLMAAAIVPHAAYVASIGGDHFEFRPVDLYFPFIFLLMGRGAAALCPRVLPRAAGAAYAAIIALGLVAIPWQSHRQFTKEYSVGFPGLGAARGERVSFLDPARDPVYRWPGLSRLAATHRDLLRTLTSRLVGVRQEEHALFLATVRPEGERLRGLVAAGVLSPDTHVAMSAVGAIPYESDLRVLDRLGLTDAVVAKSGPGEIRIMAHDRHATLAYAAASGVDLWTEDPVHLLVNVGDDKLVWALDGARASGEAVYFADAGGGDYVVAQLPRGLAASAPRFPKLVFHPASDDDAYTALLDAVIGERRRELASSPGERDVRIALGAALAARGQEDEALGIFRELADRDDPEGWYNLGTILGRRGSLDAAIAAFRKALSADPAMTPARHNLGLALVRAGKLREALVELAEAVRQEPDSVGALYTLGLAQIMAGDSEGAAASIRALDATGSAEGRALATRLRGQSPK